MRKKKKLQKYFDANVFVLFQVLISIIFFRSSSLKSPTVITGGRADRRRKMEEKKENKTLENLRAERERKKNKAGAFLKNFI